MPLQIIKTTDESICVKALADRILELLVENKKVLWLICGGSNIGIATETMNLILASVSSGAGIGNTAGASTSINLANLRIAQTDERYGPVGHKDSNWQQMIEAGFAFDKLEPEQAVPILTGLPLVETVARYGVEAGKLFAWADHVVGQFGFGPDGHIAGVLPHTIGVTSTDITIGYEAVPFTRVSLSLATLTKIQTAYAFVFGPSKKEAIDHVREYSVDNSSFEGTFDGKGPFAETPACILKLIPEAYLYTDQ